jgi:hypothetical protein
MSIDRLAVDILPIWGVWGAHRILHRPPGLNSASVGTASLPSNGASAAASALGSDPCQLGLAHLRQ